MPRGDAQASGSKGGRTIARARTHLRGTHSSRFSVRAAIASAVTSALSSITSISDLDSPLVRAAASPLLRLAFAWRLP